MRLLTIGHNISNYLNTKRWSLADEGHAREGKTMRSRDRRKWVNDDEGDRVRRGKRGERERQGGRGRRQPQEV